MKLISFFLFSALFLVSCSNSHTPANGVELLDPHAFKTQLAGQPVQLYTLQNQNGMTVQITNYGARIVALWVPAADGVFRDVVWGFDSIDDYLGSTDLYCGPIVGRFGNRIGLGQFELDGKRYQLSINDGVNHLHGGAGGFGSKVWMARETATADDNPALELTYRSPDGEEGYPGNLDIVVTYSLTPDNALRIDYRATTDAPTVLNPTSHVYFNLHGTTARSTDSHRLTIHASHFTPTDSGLIPTGEIAPVADTPLDFRTPHVIGERIGQTDFEALRFGGGYDHNFVLDNVLPDSLTLAVEVDEPATGIRMKIYTDQPGLQFYAGQGMDGTLTGKRGERHALRTGIALEAQNFPDAPNHDNFPSSVLRPGETYEQHTVYAFGTQEP